VDLPSPDGLQGAGDTESGETPCPRFVVSVRGASRQFSVLDESEDLLTAKLLPAFEEGEVDEKGRSHDLPTE
jgi:hypothetical protein